MDKNREGDVRAQINALGEGSLWVSDFNGSLEAGDYITSSSIPGYSMRQDDDFTHSYTVGKMTCSCDFTNPLQSREDGKYKNKKDTTFDLK